MTDHNEAPLVALIGRPNVGKSTLFNRLIGRNRAITHDRPGVTRDRLEGEVRRDGVRFRIVDTGGIALDDAGGAQEGPAGLRGFEAEVLSQARLAIAEARAVALVLDGRDGLLPLDERLAQFVRQSGKPVLVVVNKIDGEEHEDERLADFHALGLELASVSASHGFNSAALIQRLWELVRPADTTIAPIVPLPEGGLRLALIGRPNAGKSSILNRLLGEERMIVSDLPGTTRDSVDAAIVKRGRAYTFVDTAGIRKRSNITDVLERESVSASLKSGRMADVAIFVVDAAEGLTVQDKRLLSLLDDDKRPLILAVNKIDLIPDDAIERLKRNLREELAVCPHVEVLLVSALNGRGMGKLLTAVDALWEECGVRVSTGVLNRALREVIARHQPPVVRRRRAKFYYLTQTDVRPPTFVFFVNDPERILDSYAKYLENRLRKSFGFKHAPMKVLFRPSHDKGKE